MRTGTAARRNRIFESLSKDRQERVKELKEQIDQGSYVLRGKIELVFDEMLDEVVKSRN
jgi:anti-sigma28 factor (negative regulator of flagellin synthesis)